MATRIKDLTGKRFGRLVALGPTAKRRHHKVVWLCRCDCGMEVQAAGTLLTGGGTASCGCLRSEHCRRIRRLVKTKYPQLGTSEDTTRNRHLMKTYGITLADYNEILQKQGGACAICDYKPSEGRQRLHVDHDHSLPFGKQSVRGLLCFVCNNKIVGVLEKKKVSITRVWKYLTTKDEQ